MSEHHPEDAPEGLGTGGETDAGEQEEKGSIGAGIYRDPSYTSDKEQIASLKDELQAATSGADGGSVPVKVRPKHVISTFRVGDVDKLRGQVAALRSQIEGYSIMPHWIAKSAQKILDDTSAGAPEAAVIKAAASLKAAWSAGNRPCAEEIQAVCEAVEVMQKA